MIIIHYITKITGMLSFTHTCTVMALTLLGRLSTMFRSVFMGIFDWFSRKAFLRSCTDVGREGLACSLHSKSSNRCSVGLVPGLCVCQSSSSTPCGPWASSSKSLWTQWGVRVRLVILYLKWSPASANTQIQKQKTEIFFILKIFTANGQ